VLVVFNLLPLPPLDGSHVVKHLLPGRLALAYERFSRWGILVLMLLIMLPMGNDLLRTWLAPAGHGAERLVGWVDPFLLKDNLGRWASR
jgi:Zn-dependent protease